MPSSNQSLSVISLLSGTGERKCNARLVGQYEDRKRCLTSYCPWQSRLCWEIGLTFFCQANQNRVMKNQIIKPPSFQPSFLQGLNSLFCLSPSPSTVGWGMGAVVSSSRDNCDIIACSSMLPCGPSPMGDRAP